MNLNQITNIIKSNRGLFSLKQLEDILIEFQSNGFENIRYRFKPQDIDCIFEDRTIGWSMLPDPAKCELISNRELILNKIVWSEIVHFKDNITHFKGIYRYLTKLLHSTQ